MISHNDVESWPHGRPKLPKTQLIILSICRFAEPVALTGVFPYLPEMIESFDIKHSEVAKWAGITSAVFSLSQCLTAISWGRASDKYGRKPVILTAMVCAMSSSLLFGFSKSLGWAIIARAFSGASNGNVGILRTTIAELVPEKSLQPRAFSIMPLIWQVGSIVGPILGGSLASPATRFPWLFSHSGFFTKFPYALPNIVNAVIFTMGITTGVLFLKESLATKKYRRDYGRELGSRLSARCCASARRRRLRSTSDSESATTSTAKRYLDLPPPAYREVFSRQSSLNLLAYCILSLHAIAYDQLLPVFLHLPRKETPVRTSWANFGGGFGLESDRIGMIFTIYGVFAMVMQFTLFPWLTQRLGALTCMRACTFIFPLTYIATPYTVLMPTPFLQQLAVCVVLFVKALAGVFAFPCITILLTNSAKSLRLLGTLNGVATSLSAIGRAVGPFSVGKTFSWGIERDNVVVAWLLLAAYAVPGHLATWWLEESEGFGGGKDQESAEMEEVEPLAASSTSASEADNGETAHHVITTTAAYGRLHLGEMDSDDDESAVEHRHLLSKQ